LLQLLEFVLSKKKLTGMKGMKGILRDSFFFIPFIPFIPVKFCGFWNKVTSTMLLINSKNPVFKEKTGL
jgi:hypothetical protein